jgi:hypothetical protein
MDRSCLQKLAFQYQPWRRQNVGDLDEDGKTKNTLSFKRAALKT